MSGNVCAAQTGIQPAFTEVKALLKRGWKASPPWMRLLAMRCICALRATKRSGTAPGGEPLYVCGAFYSCSGLAQGARLYADKAEREGRQVLPVDISDAMVQGRDFHPLHAPMSMDQARPMHGKGTVVIHANPPHFQLALCRLGKDFLKHKRIVGFWAWELEAIPSVWQQALEYVDEVQVPSSFVQGVLQPYTHKPVTVIPHEVPPPSRIKSTWCSDGIVRCLYIFDAASSFERKNPWAVLRAFRKAFAPHEAELTFKISNADADNSRYANFQQACATVPGVQLITDSLSAAEMDNLYLRHDIYLSLHRSEGYGLTIREAMLHGLHVVATGWSGNREFMQGKNCHAVPYRLVPVRFDYGPCKGIKARWAEPDADAAAGILRETATWLLQGKAA